MLARPDPNTFELLPWADGDGTVGPHVLRHHQPRRHARSRATPARCCAQPRQGPRAGLLLLRRPRDGVLLLRRRRPDARAPKPLDQASYFDLTTADVACDLRKRTIHTLEAMGIPVEYSLPRGRPQPARDRPALHRRPHDGRQRHDVPARRAGGRARGRACTPRSCRSRSPACRARACTRTSRSSRATSTPSTTPATSTACRRSARGFIAGLLRHAREITAVTNQWVNSYKRLVAGYEAPVYVSLGPQQPVGRRPRAADQGGQGRLDPHRVPGARPGLQPLPRLLGDARRRPEGHRGGLRPPAGDDGQPLRAHRRGAAGRGHRRRCPSRWPRRST